MTETIIDNTVADNLRRIRADIESSAAAAGRDSRSITLVAVSKVQPIERVRAALAAGHRVFGENRVQEAKAKWPALKADYPGTELHLIGPLQTNKVKEAVALFDVIQTIDRMKLARLVADEMHRTGRRIPCYLQVNTGEEPQKAGISPRDVDAFLAACKAECDLTLVGLMCIPPVDQDPASHFALLADLARRNRVPILSMGMSDDYPTAVGLGATHVRIGSALFGARKPG
jgi:PLP dependent protein